MIKVVFMGTMTFAVGILEDLSKQYEVTMVVTQPDRPFGRKKELKPTPVKEKAIELGIKVFQPEKIRKNYQAILDEKPDLIVVAAYGQMIPSIILTSPRYRCINVHASLLPKYRGGAPMHKAIKNGDAETGVSIMYMEDKMDSGDILKQGAIPILHEDDVATIEQKLSRLGSKLLLETLPEVFSGHIQPMKQNEEEVTFAYNIKREEEHLDFNQSAKDIYNHVRGFHPYPLTYFILDEVEVKVYETKIMDEDSFKSSPGEIIQVSKKEVHIQANPGIISLKKIQLSGKKAMDTASFLSGDKSMFFSVGKIVK